MKIGDTLGGIGEGDDDETKERDRIGDCECHERRQYMTVHRGVTRRAAKLTANAFLPYIPWRDEHDHEVHEPDSPEECGGRHVHRSNT